MNLKEYCPVLNLKIYKSVLSVQILLLPASTQKNQLLNLKLAAAILIIFLLKFSVYLTFL